MSDADIRRAFESLSFSPSSGRSLRVARRASLRRPPVNGLPSLLKARQAHSSRKKATPATNTGDAEETPWNGIIIHPDIFFADPLLGPENIAKHLDLCIVDFNADGSVSVASFRDLLGGKEGICFTNAYDRNVRVDDWYYAFYHNPDAPPGHPNPIADIVRGKHQPHIKGAVLVVLNGPEDGSWKLGQSICLDDVARSIWWYHMSGNTVTDVFTERELRRYLRTVS